MISSIAAVCVAFAVHADPNKVEYELAAQCGKDVALWFKATYPTGEEKIPTGTRYVWYENHYNVKRNKCFVVIGYNDEPDIKGMFQLHLSDFNDNKAIGHFAVFKNAPKTEPPFDCHVGETQCHSEDEWRALVKPFMQE